MNPTAIRRAIYGRLAGDTTLNNLLATPPAGWAKSVYHQAAPDAAQFPYVIIQKSGGGYTWSMSTTAAFQDDVWLVKAVDRNSTADPAEAVANRIDQLLTDASSSLSISGATGVWLRPESPVDYPEESGGQLYRHVGGLYRLVVEPS